jgi:hypothetical protein
MPRTALHLWLEQRGEGLRELARLVSAHQLVQESLAARAARPGRHPLTEAPVVTTNIVWRLNHQAPDWNGPPPGSVCEATQAALLDLTGLEVADLQNELPTGGFSYTTPPSSRRPR